MRSRVIAGTGRSYPQRGASHFKVTPVMATAFRSLMSKPRRCEESAGRAMYRVPVRRVDQRCTRRSERWRPSARELIDNRANLWCDERRWPDTRAACPAERLSKGGTQTQPHDRSGTCGNGNECWRVEVAAGCAPSSEFQSSIGATDAEGGRMADALQHPGDWLSARFWSCGTPRVIDLHANLVRQRGFITLMRPV
jgi:hypothetical protein